MVTNTTLTPSQSRSSSLSLPGSSSRLWGITLSLLKGTLRLHRKARSRQISPQHFSVMWARFQRKGKWHATGRVKHSTTGRKAKWNIFRQATSRWESWGRRKPTRPEKKMPTPGAQHRTVPPMFWERFFFFWFWGCPVSGCLTRHGCDTHPLFFETLPNAGRAWKAGMTKIQRMTKFWKDTHGVCRWQINR